jgi:FkbM family methyltransferase
MTELMTIEAADAEAAAPHAHPPAQPERSQDTGLEAMIRGLLAQARALVDAFRRDGHLRFMFSLLELRRGFAAMLAELPDDAFAAAWGCGLAELHAVMAGSGARQMPPQPEDRALIEWLDDGRELTLGRLAARWLMAPASRWPLPANLRALPPLLAQAWLEELLQPVEIHHEPGDADRAARHLVALTARVHADVMTRIGGSDHDWALALARRFGERLNAIQAYFCSDNLRSLYAQRGELIALGLVADGIPVLHARAPRLGDAAKGRVRLGVLAQHFLPQTESWFTFSHLDALDRSRFDITLYAMQWTGHPLEKLFLSRVDRVKVLPAGNTGVQVELLRGEQLDVLMLATNATAVTNATARLAACRVAPLQVATVASPVTTGGTQVDVLLSAAWNEAAPDAREHYTEHLELLEGSVNYYAYQHDQDEATIEVDRASLGLAADACVLFSGANFFKLVPEQTRTWMRLLQRLPDAVLVLMPFNPNWSNSYQRVPFLLRLQQELAEHGLAHDRVKVIDPVPTRADVHRILALADVYLDPFPFSGACSLIDPLTVGVPPVVRRGRVGRSQHGASLMTLVGLESLVCDDDEQYLVTAERLATDPAERQRVRSILQEAARRPVPPWLDTAAFSQRVGAALEQVVARQRARYAGLATMPRQELLAQLQVWADEAVPRRADLRLLTDNALVASLVLPYFESLGETCGRRMIDVGACYGTMSTPFLAAGWSADLFEPDPQARERARRQLAPWSGQWRLHAAAVSDCEAGEVLFHKAQVDGLSGLGASPFSATAQSLTVPCVRLDAFCREQGLGEVDFVKIDAEGFDFDVLNSMDLAAQRPKLVMVEYGTHFPQQPVEVVRAAIRRMADAGWDAVVFDCVEDGQFARGRWVHRLQRIAFTGVTDPEHLGFGNVVFYRRDDAAFLLSVASLLESCRPASEVWAAD